MSREILFRGRRSYDKKWIEGSLVIDMEGEKHIVQFKDVDQCGHHLRIDTDEPMFYDQDTISQFIGLTDKNTFKIFEGDIISDEDRSQEDNLFVCEYVNSEGCFRFVSPFDGECLDENNFCEDLKVIGNIHENADLLKIKPNEN